MENKKRHTCLLILYILYIRRHGQRDVRTVRLSRCPAMSRSCRSCCWSVVSPSGSHSSRWTARGRGNDVAESLRRTRVACLLWRWGEATGAVPGRQQRTFIEQLAAGELPLEHGGQVLARIHDRDDRHEGRRGIGLVSLLVVVTLAHVAVRRVEVLGCGGKLVGSSHQGQEKHQHGSSLRT